MRAAGFDSDCFGASSSIMRLFLKFLGEKREFPDDRGISSVWNGVFLENPADIDMFSLSFFFFLVDGVVRYLRLRFNGVYAYAGYDNVTRLVRNSIKKEANGFFL